MSAEPAAERAALLVPAPLNAFDAAVAACGEVVFVVLRCDRAEPAADLADLLEPPSRKTFDADEAARLLVISDFVILSLQLLLEFHSDVVGGWFVKHKVADDN